MTDRRKDRHQRDIRCSKLIIRNVKPCRHDFFMYEQNLTKYYRNKTKITINKSFKIITNH